VMPLTDTVEEMEADLKLGLSTPIDIMQKRDPSMSEEEAEAQVRANIDFNKQVIPDAPATV